MKVATEADRDTLLSNVKNLVEAFVNLLPFLEEKEVRDFVEVALADGIEDRAPSPYRIIKGSEQIESLPGIAPAPKPQAKYQRAILWLSNTRERWREVVPWPLRIRPSIKQKRQPRRYAQPSATRPPLTGYTGARKIAR
jgi:hypothetical protein